MRMLIQDPEFHNRSFIVSRRISDVLTIALMAERRFEAAAILTAFQKSAHHGHSSIPMPIMR